MNTNVQRRPTMNSAISKIREFGFDVDEVVDVGVLRGTDYLMEQFPHAFHHLFEPINTYAPGIEVNYRKLAHKLHHVALSAASGEAFQVGICRTGTGVVTHSFVSDRRYAIGDVYSGAPVVECEPVHKTSLDEHFASNGWPTGRYLVKIDVDGHEMPIIQGGQMVLAGADLVIIEATMPTLLARANAIAALGFEMIDMVDMCYYHDMLSQVDLIFASTSTLSRLPYLRPWGSKTFSMDAWFQFSRTLPQ